MNCQLADLVRFFNCFLALRLVHLELILLNLPEAFLRGQTCHTCRIVHARLVQAELLQAAALAVARLRRRAQALQDRVIVVQMQVLMVARANRTLVLPVRVQLLHVAVRGLAEAGQLLKLVIEGEQLGQFTWRRVDIALTIDLLKSLVVQDFAVGGAHSLEQVDRRLTADACIGVASGADEITRLVGVSADRNSSLVAIQAFVGALLTVARLHYVYDIFLAIRRPILRLVLLLSLELVILVVRLLIMRVVCWSTNGIVLSRVLELFH